MRTSVREQGSTPSQAADKLEIDGLLQGPFDGS